jgi:hypothetical protein
VVLSRYGRPCHLRRRWSDAECSGQLFQLPDARKFWQKIEKEIKAAEEELKAKKREASSTEEQEAKVRERARKLEEERAATLRRLELSCREIANDPKLLDRLTKLARKRGVVGESSTVKAAYITATSRLYRKGAIRLLRRGAPSGGKNFVPDKILDFIPDEEIIRLSSTSPLALVYYGEGDENALKHKLIYIAEAAILAERNGVENTQTILLRTLISEGRIDHLVTVTAPNAVGTSIHIRRNGPVALLITSARDNIEDEMLTRLMTSDADESQEQTDRVVEAVLLDDEDDEQLEREMAQWRDFQLSLALEAPYDVVIPFAPALLLAIRQARRKGQKTKLRFRRDLHGFLTAIRTSAILHKTQRERDGKGRIVATLDDYSCAHEAFNPGLAALYEMRVPETMLAAVRALEALGANKDTGVKITERDFMNALGISSKKISRERLRSAIERGLIERTDSSMSKTAPRYYKLLKASDELASGLDVFPSPQAVEAAADASETANSDPNEKKNGEDPRSTMSENRGAKRAEDEIWDEDPDITDGYSADGWSPEPGATGPSQGATGTNQATAAERRATWDDLPPESPQSPPTEKGNAQTRESSDINNINGEKGDLPPCPPDSRTCRSPGTEKFFSDSNGPEAASEKPQKSGKPPRRVLEI